MKYAIKQDSFDKEILKNKEILFPLRKHHVKNNLKESMMNVQYENKTINKIYERLFQNIQYL